MKCFGKANALFAMLRGVRAVLYRTTSKPRALSRTMSPGARSSSFSLLEIIMALAILAIGMMIALRLFPLGLETSKDTVAKYNASHSADTLLHLFQLRLQSDWETTRDKIPKDKPTTGEPSSSDWQLWTEQGNTTYYHGPDGFHYVKVVQHTPEADTTDFSAIYRLWREKVSYTVYDPDDSPKYEDRTFSTDKALKINLEISWPHMIPYSQRDTALYSFDVFRE